MDLTALVVRLIPMIVSLSFHEFAHALVAYWMGDDTAERAGRLTLNPLAHIDPIGTLLLPAIGAPIGWARPTPVDPSRFRPGVNRRAANALVSAAGPLSNLLLALASTALLAFGGAAVRENHGVLMLLIMMVQMNVALCVFNLLPVPPLDGSRLVPLHGPTWQKLERYGGFILLGIVMIPPVRNVLIVTPVNVLTRGLLAVFGLGGA